jgi:hypothetical protein
MGVHSTPAKMLRAIPTYYVTETTQEDLGNGHILIKNYSRRNGVLVPEFNGIIAAPNLAVASAKFMEFVQSMLESQQWRGYDMKVH